MSVVVSEQAIRATFDEFADAWNAHDIARMVACWSESGNAVDLWGRFAAGPAGVTALLADEHAQSMGESRYRLERVAVRMLSDETAVVECDAVIDGARAPNGNPYALEHRLDAVVRFEHDRWRFVSVHPSFRNA